MKQAADPSQLLGEANSNGFVDLALSGAALSDLLKTILSGGTSVRFCARGASMSPFIKDGDVIRVDPIEGKKLKVGDVVGYVQPGSGRLIVHRVVRLRGGEAWILGDNTPGKPDGPVSMNAVFSIVTEVERRGKPVNLGLGWERAIIAWLSGSGWLTSIIRIGRLLVRFIIRRKGSDDAN